MNSLVRHITGKVELYEGSTLLDTYTHTDRVKSFTIERAGEDSKFFGFGICQRLNLKLIDKDRELSTTTANSFKVYLNESDIFPKFHITEVNRDENTNELSITAYDAINKATEHNVAELGLTNYTVREFATTLAIFLGCSGIELVGEEGADFSAFDLYYEGGANFEGTETLRDALNAISEITQTIFYVNNQNAIVFRRLRMAGEPDYTIDKSRYITLSSKTNRRLTKLIHATELGDNVFVELEQTGTTQYIYDNPFWNMRDDVDVLLEQALAIVGGFTINQFDCDWRGDIVVNIGDRLALTTKDNDVVYSYLLNDTVEYNGGLNQKTLWNFTESNGNISANPTSVGDALKETFAKVDKVNKTIDLVASETTENGKKIAEIGLTTDSITSTVARHETNSKESFDAVYGELDKITRQVEQNITAEDLTIVVKKELENGVGSITTSTGFTFNEEGLRIGKTGSEMETLITEDGMRVYRDDTEVLTADNTGVNAIDLHASTYLWIGKNSRFEDYVDIRTGCFWVGT